MKHRHLLAYMESAKIFAGLSHATKLKVGAIAVKDDRIISIGINGTPSGWTNNCEMTIIDDHGNEYLTTVPEVSHAERNCLDKLARSTESGQGAIMFCTHSPCIECAKSIHNVGFSAVYYDTEYKKLDGIEFLEKCGIKVEKLVP